jgi:hypothetical protein
MNNQIVADARTNNGVSKPGSDVDLNLESTNRYSTGADRLQPLVTDQLPAAILPPAIEQPMQSEPDLVKQGGFLVKLLFLLLVIILLVNVPLSFRGDGLAHVVPDSSSIVVHDGMLLKGSGAEIYVLDNYYLRPFSEPDTFTYFDKSHKYRLRGQIQTVDDELLAQFGAGPPIHYLVRCQALPDIYALENGQKRLVDTPLALNPESRWDRIQPVSCNGLRNLPDGPPLDGETP